MRHITKKGLDLICRFEGFSPVIYICPAGYPTIGYGHLITETNKDTFSGSISTEFATELLLQDVERSEHAVLRLINVPLSDGQFDALVSFAFNLGGGALQRSTLRRKVNREEHEDAAEEFLKWVWAAGRKLSGLIQRRKAESLLYMS